MNPAIAQPYQTQLSADMYGSTIYSGERFVRFYETGEEVHIENVYQYLEEKHQDLCVQTIDCENELVEYITEIYDAGVYVQ